MTRLCPHKPHLFSLALALIVAIAAGTLIWPEPGYAASHTEGGFTTNAAATPASVPAGSSVSINVTVTSSTATTVLVDVEVHNAAGRAYQQVFDQQGFTAGQTRTFAARWNTSATTAPGEYSVKVGIFSLGWGTFYHWNGDAADISVVPAGGTATPPPVPNATPTPAPGSSSLPPLPAGWPGTLQLGTNDGPGGASAMRSTAPFGFRYQYLSGGVDNGGGGWANWNPGGQFVTYYIQDSVQNGIVPVFTYYMIYQSGSGGSQNEGDRVYNNLQSQGTMTAYYNDLKLFFQRAGAFPNSKVVFHVEPDLWGYIQRRSNGDNAASVPAQVASTGLSDLAGLPDNVAGFAQALDRLRDRYAPNVTLAYHVSVWGTGNDIVYSNPSDAAVDQLATRAANYYRSLNSGFDIAFAEFTDRDAGFKQYQYGDGGASWWDAADFRRNTRFLARFVSVAQKRVVVWQIPFGNTKMRAMNNTWNHYQDNKVEWLLDESARTHLAAYRDAGVVAFLFGRGANGATCACDANQDGVTNPAPINGNTRDSLNADDDGGYFKERAKAYYQAGALSLGGGTTATPAPTVTPTSIPSATPSPRPSTTPSPAPAGQTVTFNDRAGQNQALNGQYPSGVIDWGSGRWFHSGPFGRLTTKSVSFAGSGVTSQPFTFVTARRLVSLEAYNGGGSSTTVTLACAGQTTKSVTIAAGQLTTITTGWTGTCTTVTVTSSNGWDTNFDNLVIDGG